MVSAPQAICAAIRCRPARGHLDVVSKRMPQLAVVSAASSCHSTLVSQQRHRAPRCWAAGVAALLPTHDTDLSCSLQAGSVPVGTDGTLNRQWTALSHSNGLAPQQELHGPDISRLSPRLQQEWDHAANVHLGSIKIRPQSNRKVWWVGTTCRSGQPHRWPAFVYNRTRDQGCPYSLGRRVCPCNSLASTFPEVAAEWDREANGLRSPELMVANSHEGAAWQCKTCENRWRTMVSTRTGLGRGCPRCANKSRRIKERRPSISIGAAHLLTEWDHEANNKHNWHPDNVTLGSQKQVHWVCKRECKLGLEHRWQQTPHARVRRQEGSPFPSGKAVCAWNSLAVQCPDAAALWDFKANGGTTPDDVAVQSATSVCWTQPDGRRWNQRVFEVVGHMKRQHIKSQQS